MTKSASKYGSTPNLDKKFGINYPSTKMTNPPRDYLLTSPKASSGHRVMNLRKLGKSLRLIDKKSINLE